MKMAAGHALQAAARTGGTSVHQKLYVARRLYERPIGLAADDR